MQSRLDQSRVGYINQSRASQSNVETVRTLQSEDQDTAGQSKLEQCRIGQSHEAWRTLSVYTAKNFTSFGSCELIKTQIPSIFGKKLHFMNSFPLNFFFLAVRPKYNLKNEKYGLKWDHFFNSTRNIYSLTMHIEGFLHFC